MKPGEDGYIEPISTPRGLPENSTFLTAYDAKQWGSDGHSHSWLNAEEIAALPQFMKDTASQMGYTIEPLWESNNFGYLFGNQWSSFIKYPDERREGLEDIRFVFWFDN